MRRLFTVLSVALTTLLVLALPALAAGEGGGQASGFGSTQGQAMLLTLIIGVVFGVGVVVDAYVGEKGKHQGAGPGDHI